MMTTREQGDAIAVLVHALRPDWDVRGIMAALAQCQDREPAALAIASVRAASTDSNRTPAVIPLAGPHWACDGTRPKRPDQPGLNALCVKHARDPRTCPWCTGKWRDEEPT